MTKFVPMGDPIVVLCDTYDHNNDRKFKHQLLTFTIVLLS